MKTLNRLDQLSVRKRLYYALMVSFVVGLLANVYPASVGGGYNIINQALSLSPPLEILCALLVVRL